MIGFFCFSHPPQEDLGVQISIFTSCGTRSVHRHDPCAEILHNDLFGAARLTAAIKLHAGVFLAYDAGVGPRSCDILVQNRLPHIVAVGDARLVTVLLCLGVFAVAAVVRFLPIYLFREDIAPFSNFWRSFRMAHGDTKGHLDYYTLFPSYLNFSLFERLSITVFGDRYIFIPCLNILCSSLTASLIFLLAQAVAKNRHIAVAAVAFAYITNRKWVFDSKATGAKEITREVVSFFLCRLATGVLDWAWMLLFVNILHFNDVLMKAVANIIVILANYIFSKLVIFKKKER